MFKYKFTAEDGRFMIITRDTKMPERELKQYLTMDGNWTLEPANNDIARPLMMARVTENGYERVD